LSARPPVGRAFSVAYDSAARHLVVTKALRPQ